MMLGYPLMDGASDGGGSGSGGAGAASGDAAGAGAGAGGAPAGASPSLSAQAAAGAAPPSLLAQASGTAPAAGAGGDGQGKVRDPSIPAWVPEKYKTGEDFRKGYDELVGRMRDAGLPPKSAEEYEWSPPEGIDLDAEATKGFREFALTAGLSKKQYAAVMDQYIQHLDSVGGDALSFAADKAAVQLKGEWGGNFQANLKAGHKVLTTFLDPKDLAEFEAVNHPAVWKLLARIGAELPEDAGLANAAGSTQSAEDELKRLQADPAYMNGADPRHKQVYERALELNGIISARQKRGMQ